MANNLQQIEIEGRVIWVEVAPVAGGPDRSAGDTSTDEFAYTSSGAAPAAVHALAKAEIGETLQALVAPIHKSLQALGPQEATVELSLGFNVKGNLFVATGEGSANLKITAKWKFDSAPAKA